MSKSKTVQWLFIVVAAVLAACAVALLLMM